MKMNKQAPVESELINHLRSVLLELESPRLFANIVAKSMNELLTTAGITVTITNAAKKDEPRLTSKGVFEYNENTERAQIRSETVSASNISRFIAKTRGQTPIISQASALIKASESDAIPGYDETLGVLLRSVPDVAAKIGLGTIKLNKTCFMASAFNSYSATPDGIICTENYDIPVEVYEKKGKADMGQESVGIGKRQKSSSKKRHMKPAIQEKPNNPALKTPAERFKMLKQRSKQKEVTKRQVHSDSESSEFNSSLGGSADKNYKPSRSVPQQQNPKKTELSGALTPQEPRVLVKNTDHSIDARNKAARVRMSKKEIKEATGVMDRAKVAQLQCAMACMNSPVGVLIRITESLIEYRIYQTDTSFLDELRSVALSSQKIVKVVAEMSAHEVRTVLDSTKDIDERRSFIRERMGPT